MTYASKNGIIFKKKLLKNNCQKTCICQKLAVLLWCEIVRIKKMCLVSQQGTSQQLKNKLLLNN
jgi:hypothetical protein